MRYLWLLMAAAEEGGHGPSHEEHYIGPIEEIFRGFLPGGFFQDYVFDGAMAINPWEIAVLSIPFIASILVMNHFLFKPMGRVFEERERRTEGFREEAEELEEKFRVDLERFESHMADARRQASEARANIRKEAAEKQDAIMSAARQDMAETLDAIREEVAKERAEARKDLERRAGELASELAAKVLGRPVRMSESRREGA